MRKSGKLGRSKDESMGHTAEDVETERGKKASSQRWDG